MVETSARLLALLSLLQERRDWAGAGLAARLEVGPRTVRRDVERLRGLGYPIEARRGVAGGYRLGAGAALPPLLLDDAEAVAVAVGLRTAAGAGVAGIEETSVRALAKLEQVLPAQLRRRVARGRLRDRPVPGRGPQVDGATCSRRSPAACRDHERLRFAYRTRRGEPSRREAEPLGARPHRPPLVPRRLGPAPRGLAHVPRRPHRGRARRGPLRAPHAAQRRPRRVRLPVGLRRARPLPGTGAPARAARRGRGARPGHGRHAGGRSTTTAASCGPAPTGSAGWRSTSPRSASTSPCSTRRSSPSGSGSSPGASSALHPAEGGGGGIRTLGAGVTHTTVFETAPIQPLSAPLRGRARARREGTRGSAPGREERPQQRGALVGQQPAGDLGAVVEPRLGEHVEHAAGGARLRVGGPVDDARDARRARSPPRTSRTARASRRARCRAAATSRARGRPRAARASRRGRSGPGAARARCGPPRPPRRRGPRPPRRARRRARARARPRAGRAA